MRHSYIIVGLFFFFCSLVYSQNLSGTVIYGQKIVDIKTTSKNPLKNTEFANYYEMEKQKMRDISKNITYILKFNEEESSFKVSPGMSIDKTKDDLELTILHVNGDGNRYFKTNSKVGFWSHHAFGRDLTVVDSVNSRVWTITKKVKMIGKYEVIKATKEKILDNGKTTIITAWFAPSIPNTSGPVGHYGLPGLILEVHERDFIIFTKEIKLATKALKIKKRLKGDYLNLAEYKEFTSKAISKSIFNSEN